MNRKGVLFVISGPSGVGKGTIREALIARMSDIIISISATTRIARTGEIDGEDYYFISKEKFHELIVQNEFLEWANVYSNMYGTPRKFVQQKLEQGYDVLLEIDIQGAMQVKKSMPEGVFVFIAPPNVEELAYRLISRGTDSKSSIEERLQACQQEMSYINEYDYVVVNDDINEAVRKTEAIIIAERCKVKNIVYEVK